MTTTDATAHVIPVLTLERLAILLVTRAAGPIAGIGHFVLSASINTATR